MPSNQAIRAVPTWIVADDLTGACDAAVAFAQRGARTQVLLDPDATAAPGVEVVALCTGTRDLPAEQAIPQLQATLSTRAPGSLFKKIDSVFRGNTFAEIRATVDALPRHLAILAPAYPVQGRIVRDGQLIVSDLAGTRTLDLRVGLHQAGVTAHCISAQHSALTLTEQLREARTLLCDAQTQQHLLTLVQAAESIDRPILWLGSAGLAHALASHRFPAQPMLEPKRPKGQVLACIGSDHPVTLRQVDALHDAHRVALWTADGWDHAAPVAAMPIERGITTSHTIREAIAQLGRPVRCLFLTGGDTALHVCRALGITALCLQHEFAPGVPQATAMGGDLAGVTILLKSGGFGEAGLLIDIARHFTQSEEQH